MKEQVKWENCVQVKGMSGLSCAYIKRFFGHIGTVEDVKKQDQIVIVRFKHHGSLIKAHRYSGRVIDKQPLKIRNIAPHSQIQDNSDTNIPKPYSKAALRFDQDKYHQKIKYGPLDLPFHWAQSLKVVDLLPDCRARWLMHEIMLIQMTHCLHHIFFGHCQKSTYSEIKIKDMLINNSNIRQKVEMEKQNLQKLDLSVQIPNDIAYEANFQTFESETEKKIRFMLKYYFKQFGIANRALHLYAILFKNSLKPQEKVKIISDETEPEDRKQFRKIQIEQKNNFHLQVSVQEWAGQKERSQYRNVDQSHPSKAIQIFSDSCFHKNPYTKTIYDIFRDQFDGTIDNSCSADIFHKFRPYFSPNYLLVRQISGNMTYYVRLDLQLRMINCDGEKFESNQYRNIYNYQQSKDFEGQGLILAEFVTLLKHNIVISFGSNPYKMVYLIEKYAQYYCNFDKKDSSESDQSLEGPELGVFIVITNPSEERKKGVGMIYNQLTKREQMKKLKFQLFLICIENTQKFQELKCTNYIEQYVDQLDCELTFQIAKFYAKQLLDRNPDRFKEIMDPQQFVQKTLWGLYLEKSKRKAKKKVMNSMKNARNHS